MPDRSRTTTLPNFNLLRALSVPLGGCEAKAELTLPPSLPGEKFVSYRSADFLMRPPGLENDVEIAKTPSTIEFMYWGMRLTQVTTISCGLFSVSDRFGSREAVAGDSLGRSQRSPRLGELITTEPRSGGRRTSEDTCRRFAAQLGRLQHSWD